MFADQLGEELQEIEGSQTLTDKGIDILKECLSLDATVSRDAKDSIKVVSNESQTSLKTVSDRISLIEIEHLRQIVDMKDKEIEKLEHRVQQQDEMIQSLISNQSRQSDQYQQLMSNFQVLLKQSNLLEDPEQKRRSIFGWLTRKK